LELQEGLVDVAAGALERLGEAMGAYSEELVLGVARLTIRRERETVREGDGWGGEETTS
jgi:hypothetical protein